MRFYGRNEIVASAIVTAAALGLTVCAATAAFSQTPDPRDRMGVWVGRWDDVGQVKETPYSHTARVHKRVTCSQTGDRDYLACEWLDDKADTPAADVTDSLSIFAYDEKNQVLKTFGISGYKMSEHGPATVAGNVWSYTDQITRKSGGVLDMRFSCEFVTPEKATIHIDVSADGGQHWVLMVDEALTKVS